MRQTGTFFEVTKRMVLQPPLTYYRRNRAENQLQVTCRWGGEETKKSIVNRSNKILTPSGMVKTDIREILGNEK